MRKTLVVAAAIVGLAAFAAPASAATLLATTGTPLTDSLMNNQTISSNEILYTSSPHQVKVDYSSSSAITAQSNGGNAFVEGAVVMNVNQGFLDLTITPENATFTDFKFNLQLPSPNLPDGVKTNKSDFTFDTLIYVNGNLTPQTITTDVGAGSGNNRFEIAAAANEQINKIVFQNLADISGTNNNVTFHFDSLRQVSFDAVGGVPEPATWAMFILGFGFVGTMLRMARKQQGASLTA